MKNANFGPQKSNFNLVGRTLKIAVAKKYFNMIFFSYRDIFFFLPKHEIQEKPFDAPPYCLTINKTTRENITLGRVMYYIS